MCCLPTEVYYNEDDRQRASGALVYSWSIGASNLSTCGPQAQTERQTEHGTAIVSRWHYGSASDQQSTNDRKVAGSRPTKVTAWGELPAVAGRHSFRAVGSRSLDCQR